MPKPPEFYIGRRLSYDGRLCTVRYIGEITGAKGEWLGVEWDDPRRGKHSGEHQGTQYFTCLNPSPTSASFIRPARRHDEPHSFHEALRAKYSSDPEPLEQESTEPYVRISLPGDRQKQPDPNAALNRPIKFSGKIAEEVGFDKIRRQLNQLEELRIVILDGMRMWRPDVRKKKTAAYQQDDQDAKDVCPKVIELDLSRNLFEEWREVVKICEGLDKLMSLRVDGTRYRDTSLTDAEREQCLKTFSGITSLKLEENLLPWEDLARLTHHFPKVTTFSASSNLYSTLTTHPLNPTITDLTLEENLIPSIAAIQSLATLPNLRRLILKSNKVSEIGSVKPFPSTLAELDLSFNEISNWSFIQDLEHIFPGLTSLRVSHNPLFESLTTADGRQLTADDGYMLTVARLGNLKTLNHSPITPKERLNAESYYLSMITKEVQFAPESMREQIIQRHPRFSWLCEEYGEPDFQRMSKDVNPNALAARLLKIRFYLASDKSQTFEDDIPMSSTAYTVLGLVIKRFGVAPLQCKMIWETGDWISATPKVTDFDDDDYDSNEDEDKATNRVMREVEIVPGTRPIGTWVDGSTATVRIEVEP